MDTFAIGFLQRPPRAINSRYVAGRKQPKQVDANAKLLSSNTQKRAVEGL